MRSLSQRGLVVFLFARLCTGIAPQFTDTITMSLHYSHLGLTLCIYINATF